MTEDIPKLRAKIDAIDDELIALLDTRCGFVKKVGAIKSQTQQPGECYVRAGREAEMVRRMAGLAQGTLFPAAAAAQIWRIIISASLSLESALSVTACAPQGQMEIHYLAREYFGGFTPVATQPTSRRVLGDVQGGKAQIGALPMPDSSAEGAWWPHLPEGLNVFACIPFIFGKAGSPKAVLVARTAPEPTGDDRSFLSVETLMDVSQSRLKAAFDRQEFRLRWVASENIASNKRGHLVEIEGFVMGDDARVATLRGDLGASLLAIRSLGAYAMPVVL